MNQTKNTSYKMKHFFVLNHHKEVIAQYELNDNGKINCGQIYRAPNRNLAVHLTQFLASQPNPSYQSFSYMFDASNYQASYVDSSLDNKNESVDLNAPFSDGKQNGFSGCQPSCVDSLPNNKDEAFDSKSPFSGEEQYGFSEWQPSWVDSNTNNEHGLLDLNFPFSDEDESGFSENFDFFESEKSYLESESNLFRF